MPSNSNNNNNNNGDPYSTLNLPRNAAPEQIKSAYRKLALKYHPDRQTNASPEDKRKYDQLFANIGNAYEILSDERRRENYDRFGTTDDVSMNTNEEEERSYGSASAGRSRSREYGRGGGGGAFHASHPFDPFRSGGSRHGGFMDPFDLFRDVFGDDFGFQNASPHHQQQHHQQEFHNRQRSVDPFFGGGFGGGPLSTGFGGFNTMQDMMRQSFGDMHAQQQQHHQNNNNGSSSSFYSSSSSSSSFTNNGTSNRQSISTTTRIINGKRQTVTERKIYKPDGSVETSVETSGDDDFPSLEQQQQQQQQYSRRMLKGNRRSRE